MPGCWSPATVGPTSGARGGCSFLPSPTLWHFWADCGWASFFPKGPAEFSGLVRSASRQKRAVRIDRTEAMAAAVDLPERPNVRHVTQRVGIENQKIRALSLLERSAVG